MAHGTEIELIYIKNKNILILTISSFLVCALHAIMLNTQFSHYACTSALKIILFGLCPVIYFKLLKDKSHKETFSVKGDKKYIKRSFILGLCVFTVILIIFMILRPFLNRTMIVGALAQNGISRNNFPVVFIYVVLINAAFEEIFFRGFVFMTLYRMDYKRYAYGYSSLLFALYHVFILNNAVSPGIFIFCIAGLAVAGLFFNYLVVKCKSMTGSLIVHISANLALNLIVSVYYFIGN